MKIKDIRVTPIALRDSPLLNARGQHAPYALRLVTEIVSDDGIAGISEITGGVRNETALRAAAQLFDGHDPFDFNRLDHLLDGYFDDPAATDRDPSRKVYIRSALEVACYDLIGKALGRRVADLLGGVVRMRVPYSGYLFFKPQDGEAVDDGPGLSGWPAARRAEALTPEAIVAQAAALTAAFGFKSLKLKGGALHPSVETAAILALRAHFGPDMPLRFDPNASWSMQTALRYGREMAPALEYYEDPVRGQEAMAELGRALDIPLATNMCTTRLTHLPSAFRLGSERIILCDHHSWGGFQPCVTLARFCALFGRGLSMHSNSHIGISLMAMTHLAAATPNLTYALDTHYPWQREEVVAGGRIRFEDGSVILPEAPGLGVELDRAALERLHRQYLACGLTERDDQAEKRRFEPAFTASATQF